MIAIIGDIHGCYNSLIELTKKIRQKYSNISIYSVGDLVDRGNHSYEVINFVTENDIKFTPGNHDYMFFHFFKDPESVFARTWLFNGNESTLSSYKDREDSIFAHINIIKKQPLFFDLPDCFISHAGISYQYENNLTDVGNKLEMIKKYIYSDFSTDKGVLWTRDPLLDIGKLQIVGHSKHKDITFDEDSNALYIDTGACVGNKLSAVIVHNNEIVDTIEENTHLNDIF